MRTLQKASSAIDKSMVQSCEWMEMKKEKLDSPVQHSLSQQIGRHVWVNAVMAVVLLCWRHGCVGG